MESAAFVPSLGAGVGSASSSSFTAGARCVGGRTRAGAPRARVNMQFGDLLKKVTDAAKDAAKNAPLPGGDKKPDTPKASATPKVVSPPKAAAAPAKVQAKKGPVTTVIKEEEPETFVMEPQPGEPGYVAPAPSKASIFEEGPPPGPPSKNKAKAEAAKAAAEGKDGDTADEKDEKRGLSLLKEDLLRTAPETVGVGRQDVTFTYAPQAGEPGYVEKAIDVVPVSKLPFTTFVDDKNYFGKVGGIEALEDAAKVVIEDMAKKKVMKKEKIEPVADSETFDIPDYLKPLPEDTPKRRYTWKNY